MSSAEILAAVDAVLPGVRADLDRLLRIPSISSMPAHDGDVDAAAALVAELVTDLGCEDVRVVTEGGKPAVIARFPAPEGAPTVCLYAHHDVQPTGRREDWSADPFEPTERDGRLYARGAADDKGGLAVHLGALRALLEVGPLPVGVTLFIEGEEEVGSPSMPALLEKHGDLLACDVFIICDASNWAVGRPALTTSLRGMGSCSVTLSTLAQPLHSGQFGGAVPDALTALCRLVATLHDEDGSVAVEGIAGGSAPDVDYSDEQLRVEAGVLDGVLLQGTGSVADRLWRKPAISVLGLDARPVAEASNTLYPSARAKLGLRIAPGDTGESAMAALTRHLEAHAPHGARLEISDVEWGDPFEVSLDGPVGDATRAAFTEVWGVAPVEMGMGGSIPLAMMIAELMPQTQVLLSAVTDPTSAIHGNDESMDLDDFAKAIKAEALLLARLT